MRRQLVDQPFEYRSVCLKYSDGIGAYVLCTYTNELLLAVSHVEKGEGEADDDTWVDQLYFSHQNTLELIQGKVDLQIHPKRYVRGRKGLLVMALQHYELLI